MARQKSPVDREFMRLRSTFLESFDWKGAAFTRDGFARWARTRRAPPIRVDLKHRWRPFRDGEPVPREMVEAFSEYISDELSLGKFPLRVIAEVVDPAGLELAPSGGGTPDIWRAGWSGAFSYFARNFSLPEEAYCRDERDLAVAARMILRCFGESHNPAVSGEAAIAFAEAAMDRTADEYAAFLKRLWQANGCAVLFATTKEKGEVVRSGVAVSAPVTEDFYQRFRAGGIEDLHLRDEDLLPESVFVFINAAADNKEMDVRRSKAARSVALLRAGMAQFASLAPPLLNRENDLKLIAFFGTPENKVRLKTFNFREVGTTTGVTKSPIIEFAQPISDDQGKVYFAALAEYLAMKTTIILFQAAIGQHRKPPDD